MMYYTSPTSYASSYIYLGKSLDVAGLTLLTLADAIDRQRRDVAARGKYRRSNVLADADMQSSRVQYTFGTAHYSLYRLPEYIEQKYETEKMWARLQNLAVGR
jgi:hypothetical protein